MGWTVAEQLAAAGHRVRILTRSGSGPAHPLVEKIAIDVSDAARLGGVFDGAAAVFHCIHGSRYDAKVWERELPAAEQSVLAAAGEAGAVVVFPESLYSYSAPERSMAEDGPREAQGGKRGVRTALLQARAASATDTVSVVAGDFFGPRVRNAHAGERMVRPAVPAGKCMVIGRRGPAAFLYLRSGPRGRHDRGCGQAAAVEPGVACAHGPALTQREMAGAFAKAAGARAPRVTAVPGWALKAMGVFSPDMREVAETLYQFRRPFVMDSAASQAALGLAPTPLHEAAAATVAWWGAQGR